MVRGAVRRAALLGGGMALAALPFVLSTPGKAVAAASASSHVAYIYDSAAFPGTPTHRGISDDNSGSGGNPVGASIFVNAITGVPLGVGDAGTYNGYSFTNVPLSTLNTAPTALSAFDTAVLYQVCGIGAAANAAALNEINSFVSSGGKLLIYDGDRCASGEGGVPDYSHFLFPFTSNNPGAVGARGHYVSVEASTLDAGLSASYKDVDAIDLSGHPLNSDAMGDANVFVSNGGAWCSAVVGTNAHTTGVVRAYARSAGGGLAIFEGEDNWFTYGPTTHHVSLFNDALAQHWNPDGLPCATTASGITLTPPSQSWGVGVTADLTATVSDVNGHGIGSIAVTFNVTSGPDAGKTGNGTTDSHGHAVFQLTGNTAAGTDDVTAKFTDTGHTVHTSNVATVTYSVGGPTPNPTATPTASVAGIITPDTGSRGEASLNVAPILIAGGALLVLAGLAPARRRRPEDS